jgi:hypothetical protein
MAGPLSNRFQPRSLMNMGGSQDAAMRAFLQRKEDEEEQAAMFAGKQMLADPVVVEATREYSPKRPPSRLNVTPGGSGESAWLKQGLQGIEDRNLPVLQRNVGRGRGSINSLLSNIPTRQSDEFGQSNSLFFQNPRFNPQTGRGGSPSQRYGVPQRVRGLGTGSEMHKPADPRGQQLGQLQVMDEEEDEFMSYDDQMFLLALMEGSRPGKPHTPYGTAVGGGNKSWATLPSMRMS